MKVEADDRSRVRRDSLQASADILQRNMESLLEILAGPKREPDYSHYQLFSRIAVHPSTNFPGRTQENILLQLLRKKAEPDVAASMDEGRDIFRQLDGDAGSDVSAALDGKWADARGVFFERIQRYFEDEEADPYTSEEREMGTENVRTGLRRKLEEDESEEEDDEEDEAEGVNAEPAEDDDDIQMLDGPPAPTRPTQAAPPTAAQAQKADEGLPLEALLRLATMGSVEEQRRAGPRR